MKNSDWESSLFEQWGKTMGRMHVLSKRYILSKNLCRRPTNTEKYAVPRTKDILFTENIIDNVIKKQQELIEYSLAFPRDIDSFGLIHGDFEDGNFFIDRGEIKVFDFDDCHYNWFMVDMGCVEALEINNKLYDADPRDFQLEFLL